MMAYRQGRNMWHVVIYKILLCFMGENTKYFLKCNSVREWFWPRLSSRLLPSVSNCSRIVHMVWNIHPATWRDVIDTNIATGTVYTSICLRLVFAWKMTTNCEGLTAYYDVALLPRRSNKSLMIIRIFKQSAHVNDRTETGHVTTQHST